MVTDTATDAYDPDELRVILTRCMRELRGEIPSGRKRACRLLSDWVRRTVGVIHADGKDREHSLAHVRQRCDPKWWNEAVLRTRNIAESQGEFTTDDVWRWVSPPREPRAISAVLASLAREKVIRKTVRRVPSSRRICHGREVSVWESLVYRAPQKQG